MLYKGQPDAIDNGTMSKTDNLDKLGVEEILVGSLCLVHNGIACLCY